MPEQIMTMLPLVVAGFGIGVFLNFLYEAWRG
jgi:hypothetical protein